jgi:hypothetical protein
MLAAASNAIVVAFSTKVTDTARRAAEAEKVDVRQYDIIYKLTDDISAALRGMLEPAGRDRRGSGRGSEDLPGRQGGGHRRLLRHRRAHRPRAATLESGAAARSSPRTGSSRCAV